MKEALEYEYPWRRVRRKGEQELFGTIVLSSLLEESMRLRCCGKMPHLPVATVVQGHCLETLGLALTPH